MEKNKKMGMQGGRVGGYCFLGFFYETVLYMYLFFIFTYLVWLHWVFIAVQRAFSSCSNQGLLSSCAVRAFLWWNAGSRA